MTSNTKKKKCILVKYYSWLDCNVLSMAARMAGLQEDNKSLKQSLSKVETERKQAQERSNNLEKVGITTVTSIVVCEQFTEMLSRDYHGMAPNSFFPSLPLSIGEEQLGDRPKLQAEDPAAASGAGADGAQGDAGTAHRQIRVY